MDMDAGTPSSLARERLKTIAPKLVQLGDDVLFGDVWERPQLSKRDRSLITCTALVAFGWTEQMKTHFPRAIQNGVTREELIEVITHMAFYSGWPSASTAAFQLDAILPLEELGTDRTGGSAGSPTI